MNEFIEYKYKLWLMSGNNCTNKWIPENKLNHIDVQFMISRILL